MNNDKTWEKQFCGQWERQPNISTYVKGQFDEISTLANSPICESGDVLGCQNRQFQTGLRAKYDIIQRAQGWWCVIRKENANA